MTDNTNSSAQVQLEAARQIADLAGPTFGPTQHAIGVDVEQVDRWKDPPPALLRSFTEEELAHAQAGTRGIDARRIAGTWCAKEAVVKAGGGLGEVIGVRDVHITWLNSGAPTVLRIGPVSSPLQVVISIGYADITAIACALAWRTSGT